MTTKPRSHVRILIYMYQTWAITVKKCHTTLPYKHVEIEVTWESSQGPLAFSFYSSHISPSESGKWWSSIKYYWSMLKIEVACGKWWSKHCTLHWLEFTNILTLMQGLNCNLGTCFWVFHQCLVETGIQWPAGCKLGGEHIQLSA